MKKIKIMITCLFIPFIFLSGCIVPMNMNSVMKEPHFRGVITEVYANSVLISVNEDDEVRKSSDLVYVSLNVKLKDSKTDFMSGDEVVVYYDGNIAESYPAQIDKVYAIVLISPDKKDDWTDVSSVGVQHILSGQKEEWTITEKQQIDNLYEWFVNLSLTKTQFAEGKSPGDSDGGEVYNFTLHNDNSTSFVYGKYGPDEQYIIYYDEWYKVNNPSDPFKN